MTKNEVKEELQNLKDEGYDVDSDEMVDMVLDLIQLEQEDRDRKKVTETHYYYNKVLKIVREIIEDKGLSDEDKIKILGVIL